MHRVKIAHAWVWNNLVAKHRVPFIYTMCARPAVHSLSTPTMNLNYSANSAHRISWNIMLFFCSFPAPIREAVLLMPVLSPLSGARGAGLLLTIDWEIPSAFLLASGRLSGPHKCWWGWNGSTVRCLHCDLWNVPSKRILRLREFLRGFHSHGTVLNQRVFTWAYPAIYSRLWYG